jgi:hypothetical protein
VKFGGTTWRLVCAPSPVRLRWPSASAQDYPSKPIHDHPVGVGGADVLARLLADRLQEAGPEAGRSRQRRPVPVATWGLQVASGAGRLRSCSAAIPWSAPNSVPESKLRPQSDSHRSRQLPDKLCPSVVATVSANDRPSFHPSFAPIGQI